MIGTYQAGVSLAPGDAVYIDSNSRLQKATNAVIGATGSHFAESKFDGLVAETLVSGTGWGSVFGIGSIFGYAASGLTVGARLYCGTGGALQDTMPTAVDRPVAKVVSATNIQIIR